MCIVVNVNLYSEADNEYIAVEAGSHPSAISYRGECYFLSGSTDKELTGFALDERILRKYGKARDPLPVACAGIDNFYHDAFDIFRKADLLQALRLA